jgi:glycosyltransferase involved in cell wall biosynthesis
MDKVLFLVPGPHLSDAARQVARWAAELPRYQAEPCVAVLGEDGPCSQWMRDAGVTVVALGKPRLFHFALLPQLRQLVQSWRPHVIHTWGAAALRLAAVGRWAAGTPAVRLFASAPFQHGELASEASWVDRLWLGQAHRVCATGEAHAAKLRYAGVPPERIVVVRPTAAESGPAPAAGEDVRQALGLAAGTPLVACIGPQERAAGFAEAVWGFNILAQCARDLHLVMIGMGPDRPRLEYYDYCVGTSRVHFLPFPSGEPGRLLSQVDVVWVPSLNDTGAQTVLEAMTVGRPVVVARSPELAEMVVEGQTGLLFPAGDKATLARTTLGLLRNPELLRRYGEAGRERARSAFALGDQVRRLAHLYESALRTGAEQPAQSTPGALPAQTA